MRSSVRASSPKPRSRRRSKLETGVPPVRHYAAYDLRTHQQAAEVAVLDTFEDLYDQAFVED